MKISGLKPQLNKKQQYAVGLRVEGGGFAPLNSYASVEQLEEGFRDFYNFALSRGLHRPLAVEKVDNDAEWGNARCVTMPEVMKKIVDEEDVKRRESDSS